VDELAAVEPLAIVSEDGRVAERAGAKTTRRERNTGATQRGLEDAEQSSHAFEDRTPARQVGRSYSGWSPYIITPSRKPPRGSARMTSMR
jgi:hypothetical protein